MKFVKFCLMFLFCFVLSACGDSKADKSRAELDKSLSTTFDQIPCEKNNTCEGKTFGQMAAERKAMRKGAGAK